MGGPADGRLTPVRDGGQERGATIGEVLRSLVFYVVFYGGTAIYMLWATIAVFVLPARLGRISTAWSNFHRWCLTRILGIRVELRGKWPDDQVLVAAKHESYFDALDMPTLLDRPIMFPKAELLRLPLWGRAAKAYGMVGVERDQGAKALRDMVSGAREWVPTGRNLAIFPEGTRVPHGTEPPLQAGFTGLYKMLGLPVVPVAIDSGPLYHRRWKRRGTITVAIGETIPPGLGRSEIEALVHAAINVLNRNGA